MHFTIQNMRKLAWWKAIIITVVLYVFDSLWFSPMIAGNEWMKSIRLQPEMMPASMTWIIIGTFIATLIVVYGYAGFVSNNNKKNAIKVSLVIGLMVVGAGKVIMGLWGMFTFKFLLLSIIAVGLESVIAGFLIAKLRDK